jgi:hypothetical protein
MNRSSFRGDGVFIVANGLICRALVVIENFNFDEFNDGLGIPAESLIRPPI